MTEQSSIEIKPPYVAYRTFSNFVAGLRDAGIPDRIDRSVLSGLSGANQSYLLSTLRFLGFITEDGAPTSLLAELVEHPKNERAILGKAVRSNYGFIFNANFNIEAATEGPITEKFRETGLSGETVRKCVSFFVMICEAAGITISPHLRSKRQSNGNGPVRRARRRRAVQPIVQPQHHSKLVNSIEDKLLAKFPDFNPDWDAEMQRKWFDTFERFMKSARGSDSPNPDGEQEGMG